MTIAILALQGAFAEHQQMLQRLGVTTRLIRNLDDWLSFVGTASSPQKISEGQLSGLGLILPGGESTAMLRIMHDEGLLHPIRAAIESGLPVFGTCAGMILLAREVEGEDLSPRLAASRRLATMNIRVRRNAYGRQLGSFHTEAHFAGVGPVPMTFIRAPYILDESPRSSRPSDVGAAEGKPEILATVDGHIVAARQGHQLAISFHPELNDDTRLHEYFLSMVSSCSTPPRQHV